MFTGIIQAVGKVAGVEPRGEDIRARMDAGDLNLSDVATGDSIACQGVCLTVIRHDEHGFEVDISAETLRCTTGFSSGMTINLEKAMRLEDRLGGHLVSGHVDGVGEVLRFEDAGDCKELVIRAPQALAPYLAEKGSIAVNGVSLTVNWVRDTEFGINLIPHTLAQTSLNDLHAGDGVNLEVDMLARYAERILQYHRQ